MDSTSGQEPVSGSQGAGTANRPYDAGNLDENTNNAGTKPGVDSTSQRLTGDVDTSTGPAGGSAQGGGLQGRNVTGDIQPEQDTDRTGVTGNHSNEPRFGVEEPSSSNTANDDAVGGTAGVEPSVGAKPTSGQKVEQKQQGANRPAEQPSAEGVDAIKDEKATAETSAAGEESSKQSIGSSQNDGKQGGSDSKGTGEQWVKTSGVAAEGGDFDATKPGAGREADRLLEEQGIHHSQDPRGGGGDHADGGHAGQTSKVGKIKEKLHMS